MRVERNRRYHNNECFVCGKQGHKKRDCSRSQHGKDVKGVHGKSNGQTPIQQRQSTSGPARHTRSKILGMASASATPRASLYKASSKAVFTEAEPDALEVSTQNDDDYVYSHEPREEMVPLNDGLTEKVRHQIYQSARWSTERVLYSVPMQMSTSAVHQSFSDSSTNIHALVAVVQPSRCGDTTVDWVENVPCLEGPTQLLAGRLSVPGASVAAADGFWLRNCRFIGAAGGEPTGTDGDGEYRVSSDICWTCAYGDVVGPGVRY